MDIDFYKKEYEAPHITVAVIEDTPMMTASPGDLPITPGIEGDGSDIGAKQDLWQSNHFDFDDEEE